MSALNTSEIRSFKQGPRIWLCQSAGAVRFVTSVGVM